MRLTSRDRTVLLFAIVVGALAMLGIAHRTDEERAEKAAAETRRIAALSPAERAAEARAEKMSRGLSSARWACHRAVKAGLHDPASAEIEDWPSAEGWIADDTYFVKLHVQARNGYNALRKVEFVCRAKDTSDGIALVGVQELH